MTGDEAMAVLAVFERADLFESLIWRVDMTAAGQPTVKLFATCSDFFHYATADLEEITVADIPLLASCLTALSGVDVAYLGELFAARKRRMRPLPAACKDMTPATRALFDACSTAAERRSVDAADNAFWGRVAHHVQQQRP